jgi:predicted GNAT family acetyltransferase
VQFVLTRDPGELAARARAFVGSAIERNVLATVLINAVEHGFDGLFAYGLDDAGEVAYAGLRTPPWPFLTSEIERDHARELVACWLREDPELNGVNGVPSPARAIAAAWADLTGGTTQLRMTDAMHALREVRDPPRPAQGRLRAAALSERDLLVEWGRAFAVEARVSGGQGEGAAMIDVRLESGGLLVWEDSAPVCFVGLAPVVSGIVRVGPVYTPPEHRRHGYAGTAVAEASRLALAVGAERCMLFTDLSNPTSNKIYAEVGYERFGDWEEHAFSRGTASAS